MSIKIQIKKYQRNENTKHYKNSHATTNSQDATPIQTTDRNARVQTRIYMKKYQHTIRIVKESKEIHFLDRIAFVNWIRHKKNTQK